MKLKNICDFVSKYKTAIFLPIICVLQFLTGFYYDCWILATIFSVSLLLVSGFSDILCYTLFFQMFSSCGQFAVINAFAAAVLIFAKYVYDLIRKRRKFYSAPFIFTVLICAFYSSFAYKVDAIGIFQGWSLIAVFFFIYIVFVYRDQINLQKIVDFLVWGIIATALISATSEAFKSSDLNIFDHFGKIDRLKLMTGNENSLSIYCSFALSYYISSIINGKGNFLKNIIFSIIVISVGLSTLSKCFLITCSFIIFYLFVMLILKFKLKSLRFLLPALALFVIIGFIFKTSIGVIFSRFSVQTDTLTFWAKVTTGRSTIWSTYLYAITSSILKTIFGVGFFNERVITIGPHNLWIHLIYRMGAFGLILIGILGYLYYQNSSKKHKITYKTCLPILVFFMISMVESFL